MTVSKRFFLKKQIDLIGQDVLMVWYLYTVVKYIRRMHFSFVEFAITVLRINPSSWAPKIIRSFTVFTVLHNNFVYRSIYVAQTMNQRTSGLKRNTVTFLVKSDGRLYTNRSRTNPCALAKTAFPRN